MWTKCWKGQAIGRWRRRSMHGAWATRWHSGEPSSSNKLGEENAVCTPVCDSSEEKENGAAWAQGCDRRWRNLWQWNWLIHPHSSGSERLRSGAENVVCVWKWEILICRVYGEPRFFFSMSVQVSMQVFSVLLRRGWQKMKCCPNLFFNLRNISVYNLVLK